jgi:hypothetical protein
MTNNDSNLYALHIEDEKNKFGESEDRTFEIQENYIPEQMTNERTLYTSRFQEIGVPRVPKIYDQLNKEKRLRSFRYNVLILAIFNVNVAHFGFTYISNMSGILLIFLVLFMCGIFSYFVQNSLVRYISHNRDLNRCNYAEIVESHFGSFFAGLLEFLVVVWYGIYLLVCFTTLKHLLEYLFGEIYIDHPYLLSSAYYSIMIILLLVLNRIKSLTLIDFNVIFCACVHIISLIVNKN